VHRASRNLYSRVIRNIKLGETVLKKPTALFMVLIVILVAAVQPQLATGPITLTHGPRTDLAFLQYAGVEAAYAALKAGELDLLCYPISAAMYQDAVADLNIQLASTSELVFFEFDFNNNYTISTYEGVRSPMNYVSFRQALAHLIDKDQLIDSVLGGWGEKIDVPIPHALSGWWNTSVGYSPDPYQALALLDADGFVEGSSPNPYYDPALSWSAAFIRTYPSNHPQKPDEDLDPVVFYVRADIPERLAASEIFIAVIRTIGIPVLFAPTTGSVIMQKVFLEKDYHIYADAMQTSRLPPTYMFSIFHSTFWCTSNIVTGLNVSGLPNYPDLDDELEEAYYAPDYATAVLHCRNAQSLLVDKHCVSVWVWTPIGWYAYRNLLGVVNMDGVGINNKYTYINAFRVDNKSAPIRVWIPQPSALNVLYSSWKDDWKLLNTLYTHLVNVPPFNLAADQPWVARSWDIGNWSEPISPELKTNVTFRIRKDVGIVSPVTGDFMRNYTAHDVAFTIWYHYAFQEAWNWRAVSDIHHTKIADNYTIEVYFDEYSYWLLYGVGMEMPLLPKDELIAQLCYLSNVSFSLPAISPLAQYQFTDQQVVQMTALSRDETILVEGVDYEIIVNATEHCHNVIRFLTPQPSGTYYATYYTPRWSPTGYYLGSNYGLNWTDTMYSLAPHYPATSPYDLKANRYFFLETPPVGEIDFVWKGGDFFAIDIFDIVIAAGAYGSTGNSVPTPNWRPEADLAPPECGIDIFDIVTIAMNYGRTYGHPPDP
jgi:ABC-type transport system substrate-binding protein